MTDAVLPSSRQRRLNLTLRLTGLASLALGVWIVSAKWPAITAAASRGHGLHAPDLALLFAQPLVVIAHVLAAVAALALGPVMLLSRKGAAFHRAAGWTWASLMAGVAVTSLFIMSRGHWSYIHILSGITLLLLPLAVHAARRHAVPQHRRLMTWLFFAMLFGAAPFTLIPGRLMWRLFFG